MNSLPLTIDDAEELDMILGNLEGLFTDAELLEDELEQIKDMVIVTVTKSFKRRADRIAYENAQKRARDDEWEMNPWRRAAAELDVIDLTQPEREVIDLTCDEEVEAEEGVEESKLDVDDMDYGDVLRQQWKDLNIGEELIRFLQRKDIWNEDKDDSETETVDFNEDDYDYDGKQPE